MISSEADAISDTVSLYTRELFDIVEKNVSVNAFGLMITHSKEYIYIKGFGQVEIIDPNNMSDAIIKAGLFIRRHGIDDPGEIKSILDEIFKISFKNKSKQYF